VYGVLTETIGPRETAGDLLDRLSVAGAKLLLATLDGIEEGGLRPVPQLSYGVTHAPRVEVEDARIDWKRPAVAVDRLIRSCTPTPGAWTVLREDRLKLGPIDIAVDAERLPTGLISVHRNAVLVGTLTAPVRLANVQPAGKASMDALDWARGARPDGAMFG